jgi:predicted ATPase
VVVSDAVHGQDVVVGDAVNVAARLEQAAAPGEVLIGERTWQLVRDAVAVEPVAPLPLKGKDDPVAGFRLVSVRPDVTGHARHLDAPMVGRGSELGLLGGSLEQAISGRSCVLAVVLGPAGVGKSRLVQEFLAMVQGQATVLRGRCLEYGEGLTYWPIAEVIRAAVAVGGREEMGGAGPVGLRGLLEGEEHAAFVAEGLAGMEEAAGRTASREEVPWAVARLFEALARQRPLIVVLDDLHRAEPALLDLVEQVVRSARDAPILLVGIARPELLDARPRWGSAEGDATPIAVEPLGLDECGRLVGSLLGGAGLPAEVARSISEAAGGNPLFVEELVAELIDQGVLTRSNGRWTATADLARIPIPATIAALLAARLERLEIEERAVLERASVVGQVFDRRVVEALSPEPARPAVGRHLAALTHSELIHPGGDDDGEDAGGLVERFRFRHLLVRDVTYHALPKRRRAELHERLAGWLLERGAEDLAPGQDAIVGYHFEQAYRYRAELGRIGPHEAELARQGPSGSPQVGGRRSAGTTRPRP